MSAAAQRDDGRRYPHRPLLGVGGIIFDERVERVVLVKRGAPPAQGKWSFPGGLVDLGETLEEACAREVIEETGLCPRLRDLAVVVERRLTDDAGRLEYHFVIADLWGTAEGEPTPGSDAAEARWVPLEQVTDLDLTHGVEAAIGRAMILAKGRRPATPVLLPES